MIYQGVDTASKITKQIAKKLKEESVDFVVRYLVPERGQTAWKSLSASEASDILDSGLALMLVWETSADRVKGGAKDGASDGFDAHKLAADMGVPPGTVIYFAADYNVPESDFDAVEAYLIGAKCNLEQYKVGLYGSEKVVQAMSERGACKHFWQCVAWSNEFLPVASVIQYEWQGGADAKALAKKVGVSVDLDSATTLETMWLPHGQGYSDGDDVIYEYTNHVAPKEQVEMAMDWAQSHGIVSGNGVAEKTIAIALWRYHNKFQA